MTKYLFQKGVSGNPSGKPKGIKNKNTLQASEFKKLVHEKCQDAFEILWQKVQEGEPWAHQLFFKEIVDRRTYKQTVLIPKDSKVDKLQSLTESIKEFEELTHDDVLQEMSVLSKVNFEDQKAKEESVLNNLSNGQIESISKIIFTPKNIQK